VQGLLGRAIRLGVQEDDTPAHRRRVQTINLVSLGSIFLNLAYLVFMVLMDVGAFVVPVVTNTVAIVLNIGVLFLNRAFHVNAAMTLSLTTAMLNLGLDGYFFGLDSGVYLFLLVIPPVSVLLVPPELRWLALPVGAICVALFTGIALARPPAPAPIADTTFETALFVMSALGVVGFTTMVTLYHRRIAEIAEAELNEAHLDSERLLHNILPVSIAERLKSTGGVIADRIEDVSILFADVVGSTPLSERLSPDEMVALLNDIFGSFDDLTDELGLEKIKTAGDAYMVVGGLTSVGDDHLSSVAEMALRMRDELTRHHVEGFGAIQMRFGVHVGAVVAGVIGKRKFSYDLWGDTVNTAARMESHGVPNQIQVTEAVFRRLSHRYRFEERGPIDVKGKGLMPTYFLVGR
jgi:class 3 adenylate cyclase